MFSTGAILSNLISLGNPPGGICCSGQSMASLRFVYSVACFSFIIIESFFTSKTPKKHILGYNKCSIKA